MKKLFLLSVVLPIVTFAYGQGRLEVVVKGIKAPVGSIRVGLFNNEKDFLEKAVEGKVVKASGSEATVVFENLTPGEYGLSVIHDENDNGTLDSNGMGIPTEGFAFGNNATGMFGPPDFEKTKVKVDASTPAKQVVSLKYL